MSNPGIAATPGGTVNGNAEASKDAGDPRIAATPGGTVNGSAEASKDAGDPGIAATPGGIVNGRAEASKDAGGPGIAAIPGGIAVDSKGWYSRGHLPHLDQPDLYQAITFRLYDSVPKQVVQRWKEELQWRTDLATDDAPAITLRRRIVTYEDAGHGACWLHDEQIALLVQNTLFHFDGQRYHLIAWCIMPNHVHVLIETLPGHPLDQVLHSWKSFTASKANALLARTGPFWAREYHDRYIRDEPHFAQTVTYIEQNPVKAGLVKSAIDWKFSSASQRR